VSCSSSSGYKSSKEGTFVHQAKYTKDIVRKFKMEDSKAMATPMSTTTAPDADEEGEYLDQKEYRSMIGSLLYLTATRPNIQFSLCLCACFQASPRTSHQQAVKRIFRYLHHTPNFDLWYFASSSLALHSFSNADFTICVCCHALIKGEIEDHVWFEDRWMVASWCDE
jgi:hypothetical protein